MRETDIAIIGAGMAGACAGYHLAPHADVLLLERESAPGYHTTGRSAAFYAVSYGGPGIRPLTAASRAFFDAPPEGFTDRPILSARGALHIARADQMDALQAMAQDLEGQGFPAQRVSAEEVAARIPALRPGYAEGGLWDAGSEDIDVDLLHRSFLAGLKQLEGAVQCDAEITGLIRQDGAWHLDTSAGPVRARLVVNAAGAWADGLAAMAGARPLGIQPMRRTVILLPPPAEMAADWPLVIDVDEQFYFKPQGGQLLASPADETPMAPCDAQPEEMDIAVTVERLRRAIDIDVQTVAHSWAGLRSFAPDRTPVVGFDPQVPDFFWFAGQGGYGIQTAPMMGQFAADMILGRGFPRVLSGLGADAAWYSPSRFG